MSAPQKNANNQIYLHGTQINFYERTQHKERKNCENRAMSSRPYSAISDINSYERANSLVTLSKRPFSADTVLCAEKNSFANNNKQFNSQDDRPNFCETQPARECSNETPDLPSAKILKSLLSESLEDCTWNNMQSSHLYNLEELTDKSTDDPGKNVGRKIQELSQSSLTDVGTMVPGIASKPPLPTKVRTLKIDMAHVNNSAQSSNVFAKNKETANVFEFMTNGHEELPDKYLMNETLKPTIKNDTRNMIDNCYVEDLEELDKADDCSTENEDKTAQDRDVFNSQHSLFHNWVLQTESDNITEQTKLKEKQTDRELQNLQKQQEDLNENIYNIEHLFDTNKEKQESCNRRTNTEQVRDVYTSAKHKMNDKFCKVSKPIKLPKTKQDNHDSGNKKQPKSILKVVPKKNSSVLNNVKNVHSSKKGQEKIEARQTEAGHCHEQDVTSWMSTNAPHENFLDFLNKLDDFESVDENTQTLTTTVTSQLKEKDINVQDEEGFDEIASILQVLEKEDLKSQKNIESMKEIMNNELSDSANAKHFDTRSSSTSSLTSTSSNYNDFLSYLDEIDQSCISTLQTAKERIRTVTKVNNATINIDKIPRLEDLLNYSNVELAHYVADLTLRLKERSAAVTALQTELSKLRNTLTIKSDELDKTFRENLKAQKDDYESVIRRHQKFIDQLIADKKSLNKQCEGLINEMKVLEDRYNTNIKAMEQRHKIELQKSKDMHAAGEKLRREKWIEGKTQKIKEMTVKSLEPELQNMTMRHQQELTDLRSLHKRELEDLELRAARKTQQQCEALRQQLTAERETAIAHERDILRQRLEKLVESEEKSYQEQRRRLNAEHSAKITECDERVAAIINERDRVIESVKSEFEDQLQTAVRRHKVELKNVRESMELEFEVWKNNFKKQQTIKLAESEAQMKEACKKDRDREIEMVIERLEQETNETREQIEQATENRLRRIKEKYEEEIKDLEKIANEYKTKYSETKEKLLNQDEAIINLKTNVKHLQTQLQQSKDIIENLSMDKNKMRDQIKGEFQTEINSLENEVKTLKNSKEEELQRIFAKVKLTVAHKDELLSELTKNNSNLQEKCTLLENLLEQQRKEYLIK